MVQLQIRQKLATCAAKHDNKTRKHSHYGVTYTSQTASSYIKHSKQNILKHYLTNVSVNTSGQGQIHWDSSVDQLLMDVRFNVS